MEFFLEKTGCDAATLSAPFLLHGSEAGLLETATLQSDPSIHLSFACEELLVNSQVILTHEVAHLPQTVCLIRKQQAHIVMAHTGPAWAPMLRFLSQQLMSYRHFQQSMQCFHAE